MGADGHIQIWRAEMVRAAWPNADELFGQLSSHYTHELCGVMYDHCYYGDNIYEPWDSMVYAAEDRQEEVKRFVDWLENNTDATWEVWT